jgi:outer membrane lipoprotein SlyB
MAPAADGGPDRPLLEEVASLTWPGGTVTGNTICSPELSTERLELLQDVVPVTPVAADRDIASCMELAASAGADAAGSGAGQAAGRTAGGAAVGAAAGAVGGAVVGSAGSGSAIGAANGATAGLLHWLFSKPHRSPAFENFVNRCLQERGYEPVGWN